VNGLLREVRAVAEDPATDREARISLRGDIDRVLAALEVERVRPQAVAFFSCSGHGVFEEVELPRPVRDRQVIDADAWVRPLVGVLDEYHRCRVAVVDRGRARFFDLYQDEMQELAKLRDRTLRKPDYAYGMRESATHNKAGELAKRHYRAVVGRLAEDLRAGRFDILAIGGHAHEIDEFMGFLTRDLRDRVAGTFEVHPRADDLGEIRKEADAIVERYERDEERRLVDEAMEKAAMRGWAAVGVPDCLWGGTTAAIDRLLVQDGVERPGVVCDHDGWMGLDGAECPVCGRRTRAVPDVLDELVQEVMDEGGSVEHVLADTPLREHVTAAHLRFPLPPGPTAAG
jgi:peptide chain release factor subunit 1